jgi:hypothetical protein
MRSLDSNILSSGNSVSWKRITVDLWNRGHFVCSGEAKYSETQTKKWNFARFFSFMQNGESRAK